MRRILFILSLLLIVSFATEDSLRIQNQKTIPGAVQAGDKDVILQFDLNHAGRVTYSSITVTLALPQQFEGIKTAYSIDRLSPGQSITTSFRLNVKQTTDPGTYTIPIVIKYTDTSGPYDTATAREVYLSISSTPTLKFEDIIFSPLPHIGKQFNVIFTVNNTGALPASNVLAAISMASVAQITCIPDSQIIDYTAANALSNISFKGIVSSETAPGAYQGAITLIYSNKTLTNAFIIEVHGQPELNLAGSQTDKTPYVGEKFTLSVQLEDTGKEKARSVQVRLNDSTIAGTLTSYIGTIDLDDTGSAIFDITLSKGGSYTIPLEFTYTDDEGNIYTRSESITFFVYSRPFDFSGIFLLIIIIAAVWYWQNRKKKKHHIERIVD